jgi:PTS system mannose-specific IIA component
MIKIIIAAHDDLAQALLNSAESIAGKQTNLYAVKRDANDSLMQMQEKIDSLLKSVNDEDGTLILVDIMGGTPYNASAPMCKSFNTEILAGVNLPMVLSAIFSSKNATSAFDIAEKVLLSAQKSIVNVKKMLSDKMK